MSMYHHESPFAYGECEVCESRYKILLRYVGTARTHKLIPLFYCMECESLTCIGEYVEDESQLINDLEYNVKMLDHKLERFARLAKFLGRKLYIGRPSGVSHADIGCNIGVLVKTFAEAGYNSVGYDINPFAIERARALFPGHHFIEDLVGADGKQYELLTVIDVLEHIKAPAEFFKSILSCILPGGHIFINVPRVDRDSWGLLGEASHLQLQSRGETPFRDNDVHVVHYSSRGLTRIGQRFGLQFVEDCRGSEWPLNGMLFRRPPRPAPPSNFYHSRDGTMAKAMQETKQQIIPKADVTTVALSNQSDGRCKIDGLRILRHLSPHKMRQLLAEHDAFEQMHSELQGLRHEQIREREQMRSELQGLRDEQIREREQMRSELQGVCDGGNFIKYNVGSVTLKLPSAHQLPNYQRDSLYYDRFLPFLAKYTNKDSVILEVGANVGDTVAGLIQSCTNKIIAIEGHPVFHDLLCENVASFPCPDRIVAYRALVGSGKYLGTLVDNGSTASLRLDGKTMVSRLDEIVSELKVNFQKVALIIIDTDGYDGDVLNSASRIIRESKPIVYWENYFENADQYNDLQEAYRLLTDNNYEYFTIFDNFGVPLMANANLDALMNFNRYVEMTRRSSASRPSIFYTDVCATTEQNKEQVSNAIMDCYGTLEIQTM